MPVREQKNVAQDGVEISGVAGRYASALYDLASQQGVAGEVASALAAFQVMIDESPDLRRLVRSPVFSAQDQIKALTAILARARIGGIAANFIKLVATKRRLFVLPDMISAYQRLHDAANGLVRADVTVARPLAPQHENALRQALGVVTGGKTVALNVKTDASIIGGIIVKIGSRMVDSSLRTKLNSIRTRMKEVG